MNQSMIRLKSGLNIHILEEGKKHNPPLILLHGYPSSGYLWRHMMKGLSRHFHVLAPDLPGHGRSDKPANVTYTLDFFHEFLLDFFEAMQIDKACLVAHDLGGMAALGLAVRNPEKIDRLVIMNTGPYKDWPMLLKIFLNILKLRFLSWAFLSKTGFKMLLKQGLFNGRLLTHETAELYRRPWILDHAGKLAFCRTIDVPADKMVEPVERLRGIRIPTMVLWGRNDRFFPKSVAWRLHHDIDGSRLVFVDRAGHFLQEEQPEAITHHLMSFLGPESME